MRKAPSSAGDQHRRDRVDDVVAVVRAADSALSTALVTATVERVAPAAVSQARLARYLTQHPDALIAGHSRPPKVVGALIAALVEAGSSVLVIPRCADCDRAVELFHTRGPDERICSACWRRNHTAECVDFGWVRPIADRTATGEARCKMCSNRANREECGTCGRFKQVARRNPDGSAGCSTCLRRDTSTWAECVGCSRQRPVNSRTEDGGALCPSCYTQPTDTCSGCEQSAVAVSRADGQPLCYRCYRHPRRAYGGCGRVRRVAVRGRDGGPDLCPTCHQAPVLVYATCGAEERCRTTTADKSAICFRCQLARRLDEVLAGPSGEVAAPLAPLREAILAVDNPRTPLGWLGRSPAISVLTAMARGEKPLTHETLDAAAGPRRGRAFAVEHLRQLLIACAALPERDRHLARLETALIELLDAAHPEDRQLLRTYATWRLLSRVRAKAERGEPTHAASCRVRELTAEAARFLAWLRDRDTSLAACTEAELDDWLSLRPRARGRLVGFLSWARGQRLVDDLEMPWPSSGDPVGFVADDHRWQLARRALTDDAIAARDRVAALLLLLYGQTAARIVRLTRADLHIADQQVQLRLGAEHIVLPPPLDGLIKQLPDQTPVGMAGNLATGDQWLFPGRRPGQPMHPITLGARLKELGIEPRAARNTTLLQLGAELPSLVLADLLGIHINTAERWCAAAGARWTTYAAMERGRRG